MQHNVKIFCDRTEVPNAPKSSVCWSILYISRTNQNGLPPTIKLTEQGVFHRFPMHLLDTWQRGSEIL